MHQPLEHTNYPDAIETSNHPRIAFDSSPVEHLCSVRIPEPRSHVKPISPGNLTQLEHDICATEESTSTRALKGSHKSSIMSIKYVCPKPNHTLIIQYEYGENQTHPLTLS